MDDPLDIRRVLHEAASAVSEALRELDDWGPSGRRSDQYHSDLVADRAALEVIEAAGFGAYSEESGGHGTDRPILVVLDPVDGSTNASRGLPWWATSLCALDAAGPVASVVVNQATGTRFDAVRGGGARMDGARMDGARVDGALLGPSSCQTLDRAIVALNGYPRQYLGWCQYRTLGAAALDLCAVAAGQLDAFIDCAGDSLAPWDYLGALLVCREAGAFVGEAFGRELVVRDGSRRTIVAAATRPLLDQVIQERRGLS